MKTSYFLSTAFKVVGIVFFLETLRSVSSTISFITVYINGAHTLSVNSIPDFSFSFIVMAGFTLLLLFLTTILILYSDRIAKYLVKSNDRDVGINQDWKGPDILLISIQIIAILIVAKGCGFFLKNAAKSVCLILNQDILREVLDSRMRLEIGSELITSFFIVIFGGAFFVYSHRIAGFLDRFNK